MISLKIPLLLVQTTKSWSRPEISGQNHFFLVQTAGVERTSEKSLGLGINHEAFHTTCFRSEPLDWFKPEKSGTNRRWSKTLWAGSDHFYWFLDWFKPRKPGPCSILSFFRLLRPARPSRNGRERADAEWSDPSPVERLLARWECHLSVGVRVGRVSRDRDVSRRGVRRVPRASAVAQARGGVASPSGRVVMMTHQKIDSLHTSTIYPHAIRPSLYRCGGEESAGLRICHLVRAFTDGDPRCQGQPLYLRA